MPHVAPPRPAPPAVRSASAPRALAGGLLALLLALLPLLPPAGAGIFGDNDAPGLGSSPPPVLEAARRVLAAPVGDLGSGSPLLPARAAPPRGAAAVARAAPAGTALPARPSWLRFGQLRLEGG